MLLMMEYVVNLSRSNISKFVIRSAYGIYYTGKLYVEIYHDTVEKRDIELKDLKFSVRFRNSKFVTEITLLIIVCLCNIT